ncbi:NmrA family NAD(P)-binding protein [Chitinophaga sp. GbtcB8]|uniref:NmrA family NAD(P)-binding protein n=1 Tax=Chitinophaga sp. GbtcB8 TaxID=2824753 RepID=UPI001C310107|nr:NmrA family NAD(P)-binding protein [Chitinophaga sp. GbtcB8]
MKVVVTGSLGHVAQPLAKGLVQKGHKVTVISSKAEKQKDIEALGATAAIGSLENVDFLVAVLTGADAVFAMVPPNFAEPDQIAYYSRIGSNYAQAIQQSGIKRVVHLSSYGAHLEKDSGFILGSHKIEGLLNSLSGIAITHLRAGYFYYNLYNLIDIIKEQGFMAANYGTDDKLILVHPEDIAAAALDELETAATGKNVRYVVSDERTANEIAGVLGAAIGKPDLKWLTFTNEQTQERLEKKGVPVHIAAKLVEMGASLHSGALIADYELHKPAAMGKIKLETFAKEFAAAF